MLIHRQQSRSSCFLNKTQHWIIVTTLKHFPSTPTGLRLHFNNVNSVLKRHLHLLFGDCFYCFSELFDTIQWRILENACQYAFWWKILIQRPHLEHIWLNYASCIQTVWSFEYPGFCSQFGLDFNIILVSLSSPNCLLLPAVKLSPNTSSARLPVDCQSKLSWQPSCRALTHRAVT